jgi:uncharacterized protein
MRFTQDRPATVHVVRSYVPGRLRLGERELTTSVVVSAATLVEPWRPRHFDELVPADLEAALGLSPEVLLLGTGVKQRFPGREVYAALHAARVGFEIMDTGAACRTYNVLLAEDRRVVAALLLE